MGGKLQSRDDTLYFVSVILSRFEVSAVHASHGPAGLGWGGCIIPSLPGCCVSLCRFSCFKGNRIRWPRSTWLLSCRRMAVEGERGFLAAEPRTGSIHFFRSCYEIRAVVAVSANESAAEKKRKGYAFTAGEQNCDGTANRRTSAAFIGRPPAFIASSSILKQVTPADIFFEMRFRVKILLAARQLMM